MIRNARASWLPALMAGAGLLLASPRPAAATFTVEVRGSTTMITQTDTDTLIVTRMFDGALVVTDSGSLLVHPPTNNLVVRGVAGPTPAMLFVVLDSELPGSLMLDLPGASTVTVRGDVGAIGGALKVNGGPGPQVLRLGTAGQPLTIGKTATVDLGDAHDQLFIEHGGTVEGSFNVKGVNEMRALMLSVDRSFSFDVSRESIRSDLNTRDLVVGKSFKMIGGPAVDYVDLDGGTIGRSVTFDLGGGSGIAYLFSDTIGGNVKAAYGAGGNDVFALGTDTVLKGSLALTLLGDGSDVYLDGAIEGTSIKIAGTPGVDGLNLNTPAPRANATIDLGAGDDDVGFFADRLRLKRLALDLGDGADDLHDGGWVLPPGSTITGLP